MFVCGLAFVCCVPVYVRAVVVVVVVGRCVFCLDLLFVDLSLSLLLYVLVVVVVAVLVVVVVCRMVS